MRRITLWLLSTVAVVVLLFSYKTSTMGSRGVVANAPAGSGSFAGSPDGSSSGGSGGSAASGSGSSSNSGTSSGSGTASAAKSFEGPSVQTRWGPVQVAITVTSGKITNVWVPVYPTGNSRDHEINSYALPVLRQETLSAQSASIDTVSGATVTSDGYIESLQSALDAAHLR